MFLNLLQSDQQIAFVHAARAVVEQDSEVAQVELALLDALRAECGLDELPPVRADADVASIAADALQDDVARRVFMIELAGVAVIDGDAQPAEVELVSEIGAALGITGETLAEMFDFAESARQLIVVGQRIIATGLAG